MTYLDRIGLGKSFTRHILQPRATAPNGKLGRIQVPTGGPSSSPQYFKKPFALNGSNFLKFRDHNICVGAQRPSPGAAKASLLAGRFIESVMKGDVFPEEVLHMATQAV